MTRLTLKRGEWYGWTMWPGYGDQTYFSPVEIHGVLTRGDRTFDLAFNNLGYAEGVQDMTYSLKTLRREERYILAAVINSDRSVAIEPMSAYWFNSHRPDFSPTIAGEMGNTVLTDRDLAEWLQQRSTTKERI